MTIPAFPLQWPAGWKRTSGSDRTRARFSKGTSTTHRYGDGSTSTWRGKREVTIAEAVERVRAELKRMGIHDDDLVISTNLVLRMDGLPRSSQREPNDPGAAVYWTDRFDTTRAPMCMAIDRYDRVADNLAAIAATLEAMRAIERHGGAEILKRSFQGFAAIEAPKDQGHWSDILDCDRHASTSEVRAAFLRARSAAHPDKQQGGSSVQFNRVVQAYQAFCVEHGITE